MGIGERIKKRRRELDISQEKLAELVDVHENTIRKWEQGTRSPDAQKLNLLASALGTTVGVLMGEVEPEQSEPKNNLPISNAPEAVNDDLDLAYWGGVVERAERIARKEDSSKKTLIAGMLKMATEAITGAEAKSTAEKSRPNIIQNAENVQGDVNQNARTS